MPTTQPKKIGGVALAAALVVAALAVVAAPTAAAGSGDCSNAKTLTFDQQESDSLQRPTDTRDKWVVDVPDRPSTVQLDVDLTSGDPIDVELYEENGSSCDLVGSENVVSGPEFEGLSDDQKYWPHVVFNSTTGTQADYTIIMEDD
jgi:hypothetical protein